jgi:hypothetical protein
MSGELWVLAFSAATEAEGAVVAGFLESQGIPVNIETRSFRQEPVTFGALVQIRLLVAPDQLELARQVLEERDRRFVLIESDGADEAADENGEDAERRHGEPPETAGR